MKKLLALSSVLIQLGLQPLASACPDHPRRGGPIKAFDSNGDGQLSQDEVKDRPFLADKFSEIDSDKNGQLSAEELKAHRKAHRPQRPDRASEEAAPAE